MPHDPRVLLMDMEQAGADIEYLTEGMNSTAYVADMRTQGAVERKFEIIGEALKRLYREYPELAERVPRMREIIAFRNVLAHAYDHVTPERVWMIAEGNLPQLREAVQALLAELGPPEE